MVLKKLSLNRPALLAILVSKKLSFEGIMLDNRVTVKLNSDK